jgi:hypothetical protein
VPCDVGALITAIKALNATGGGTLTLATGCTYTLTGSNVTGAHGPDGLPLIVTPITLSGNGTTITRAGGAFRIVEVTGTGALTTKSVTISNGSADSDGGGIYNDGGTVTFTSGNLSSNSAAGALGLLSGRGGGMYDNGGTVTITSSFVKSNTAHQAAGIVTVNGIFTLTSTAVTSNGALVGPGGIDRTSGAFTNNTSDITANTPTNCAGSVPAVPGCTN